jgi:hypothetical protein
MLTPMTASPPPEAERAIERAYRMALAIQQAGLDTAVLRASMLITTAEAFALLDCARMGPWHLSVPTSGGGGRTVHYDLTVGPRAGVAWARLFGVTLIVDKDVIPDPPP